MSAKCNQPSGETFHTSQLEVVGMMLFYPQYSVVVHGYIGFTLSVHLSVPLSMCLEMDL